jgi:hypothetical protein
MRRHRQGFAHLEGTSKDGDLPRSAGAMQIRPQLISGTWKCRVVKKFVSSVCFTEFSAFSFILHLLMEIFPFVFSQPVDPCFKDGCNGFLSNFVENLGDRRF